MNICHRSAKYFGAPGEMIADSSSKIVRERENGRRRVRTNRSPPYTRASAHRIRPLSRRSTSPPPVRQRASTGTTALIGYLRGTNRHNEAVYVTNCDNCR